MKITSGDLKVLGTGTVVQFKEKPIDFLLRENDVSNSEEFTLRFNYLDKEGPEDEGELVVHDEKFAEVLFYSSKKYQMRYTVDPIEVGTLNNKNLYVVYIADKQFEDGPRVIHYTWYIDKEEGQPNAANESQN